MTLPQKIYGFLNIGDHVSARNIVRSELAKLTTEAGDENIIEQSELYGFLIDIGTESQTESDLTEAIKFMKANQDLLSKGTSKPYYYYNLANAVDGAARIFYFNNRGVHPLDIQKQWFQESIQYYWTALNSVSNDHNLRLQISINLSNALIVVGRGVEAVQFQDEVLTISPKYPQALISRADHLNWIRQYTNCAPTIAMFMQIHHNYDDGIKTNTLPPHVLQRTTAQRAILRKEIEDRGFTLADSEKEIKETKLEFEQHTPFRKYSILNHLTLNEHGIYCGCVANEKDDLRIGVHFGAFRSEVLPKLELLVNRLKSEFAFARWSYYNSLNQELLLEFDVLYSDLLENEVITPKMELMRSSFRICYGILDKIALGICKLFNVPAKRIHFETFWEDSKIKPFLNHTRNLHLNALYSIACDLNTTSGELKHFKNWRNKLEHNLLIVKDTMNISADHLKVFEDKEFVAVVDTKEFEAKALHLLQLTRAAIISFVYCVRLQTIEHPSEDNKKGFPINFKSN